MFLRRNLVKGKCGIIVGVLLLCSIHCRAQFIVGTTGLLHLPTADMQKDKTAMIGGSWLSQHATPSRWYYDTWNYYLNITILPFLEVSYDMTLFKGDDLFRNYPSYYRKFYKYWANQDRNFSVRLRAIKEGQFFPWMPQIVLGGNDVLHSISKISDIGISESKINGFWGRLYIAASKHFAFEGVGNLGTHVAWLYTKRNDFNKMNGPGCGANFRLGLNGDGVGTYLLNGIDVMAEYDSHDVNAGLAYHVWDDHINLYTELKNCKYFSGGVQFKIYLK